MHRHPLVFLLALVCSGLISCGGGDSQTSSPGKDRGYARMTLGDRPWEAERAKARTQGDLLRLSFTNMDSVDGVSSRQELKLVLTDYTGPGTYTTGGGGSMFVSVVVNTGAILEQAKAGAEDAGLLGGLGDAAKGSQTFMLNGARVEIDSDEDGEVEGSFSWESPNSVDPAITKGRFRALRSK